MHFFQIGLNLERSIFIKLIFVFVITYMFSTPCPFIPYSCETVASILGPSSSALEDIDHPLAFPSVHLKNRMSTPSAEFLPCFTDSRTPPQLIHDNFESIHANQEYPTSVEPYMWDLVDDKLVPSLATTDNEDSFFVSSIKQWPLTEDRRAKKGVSEGTDEHELSLNQHHSKKKLLIEQNSVQTSKYLEGLHTRHQALSSSQSEQG